MQNTSLRGTGTGTGSGVTEYLLASSPGWLGVLGGIWLIIAPFVFSYNGTDKLLYNDIAAGVAMILLFGYYAASVELANTASVRQLAVGVAGLGGVWLIVAPFILDYTATTNAMWNDIVAGSAFVVLALYIVLYHTSHFTHTDYA